MGGSVPCQFLVLGSARGQSPKTRTLTVHYRRVQSFFAWLRYGAVPNQELVLRGRNRQAWRAPAVGQRGRDDERALVAHAHALHAHVPPLNDLCRQGAVLEPRGNPAGFVRDRVRALLESYGTVIEPCWIRAGAVRSRTPRRDSRHGARSAVQLHAATRSAAQPHAARRSGA